MFIHPDWPAPSNIHAATTLRDSPGTSQPPYHQCNLATHVGDQLENVEANRLMLKNALKLPFEPIWLNQTHSNQCVRAVDSNRHCTADASYTNEANKICVVLTADCLPILLCDHQGTFVSAIHAGWRGLHNGIIKNAILSINRPSMDIMAWLGPAIGPKAYEVGDDVRNNYINQDDGSSVAFIPSRSGHWFCNLYMLAKLQLKQLGIHDIYGGDFCTFKDDRFYSHRRDNGQTGRMASLIWFS